MDKRTLLAVVLSVVVITIGFVIQNVLFPPEFPDPAAVTSVQQPADTARVPSSQPGPLTDARGPEEGSPSRTAVPVGTILPQEDASLSAESITLETERYIAVFSNRGGVLTSLKLKEHTDGDDFVDMLFTGEEEQAAFELRFGGPEAEPLQDLFHYRRTGNEVLEFYRTYVVTGRNGDDGVPFTIRKRFTFTPGDYLVEVTVSVENSVNEIPVLGMNDDYAYTLGFGPQIGPEFSSLDGRQDFRNFFIYQDQKRKNVGMPKEGLKTFDERLTWAAIAGKYFTVIGIPDATLYRLTFSTLPRPGIPQAGEMSFSRPPLRSSRSTDTFRFYMGPKLDRALSLYNDADRNAFNVRNLELDKVIDTNVFLGWLETILKYVLLGFYKIIPNYGVAIILLTIVSKIVLYPLTHKSLESTSKMQALAPKIEELKQKHKNSPTRLNQEMAELYKREGANPLGGCLPMVLQIPVFFALYGLLNSHFDLRGATFIPGWITDLSAPESIFHLPFAIPVLNWTELRLLPFIYVGTQLLTQRFTTTPDTSPNSNMKMMMYMMPLVFFFIMYDMPSGLLLYWTMTNVLTTAQQLYINKHVRKKWQNNGESPVRK